MKIENERVVALQFELKNDDGEMLDASNEGEPLLYLHGADNIVPGLENALTGKAKGDTVEVVVNPADGYGEYDEELIQTFPIDSFDGMKELAPGLELEAEDEDGAVFLFVVKEVKKDEVILDGNHPLAGMRLHFKIEVEDIREAGPEELEHGHAHDPNHEDH